MLDIWPLVVLVHRRFSLVSFMNHSHEIVVVVSPLASDYEIKCPINLCRAYWRSVGVTQEASV